MGTGLSCGKMPGDFRVLRFQDKNSYPSRIAHGEQELEALTQEIAPGIPAQKIKNIASFVLECPAQIFDDCNFHNEQHQAVKQLAKLYDFRKQGIDRLYSSNLTLPELLNQRELELAYCSAVMYLICQQLELKRQLMLTRHLNAHHTYIFQLFCNGAPCAVAVDDFIPVHKDTILFMNVSGKELWPILLEKAWAKQIGGYALARGLSPEDSFEEITGIPAYSFILKNVINSNSGQILQEMVKNGYWLILTAHATTSQEIRSRQIFSIEEVYEEGKALRIRSPYHSFSLRGHQQIGGAIKVELQRVLELFEFLTVGYFMQGYELTSLPISSAKDQEVIVELAVKEEEPISIRFQQFYQEYLDPSEKPFYKYSPLCIELYDHNKELIEDCQGIPEANVGTRSSHFSHNIFATLKPGLYFLRLQVSWINQKQLHAGNLVAYAKPGFDMRISEGDHAEISRSLIISSLQGPRAKEIEKGEEQGLIVRWREKQYRYLLSIENITEVPVHLRVNFKDSLNISINHYYMKDHTIDVKLEGRTMTILEIVPADPQESFHLAPFEITKL